MMRIIAFSQLLNQEKETRLAPWIKLDSSDPNYFLIKDELIALAGRFPVDYETITFDADAFVAEAAATISIHSD